MERLPLASVRAFAVVARYLSISRASEELNVTPSAVSHQIRLLERYLGVALFHRQKNKLKLTAPGERYMTEASEALLLLSRATKAIKSNPAEQVLRIGAPPSLALLWLIPRLGQFSKAHRDISLHVTASPDATAHLGGAFDVGLWYGNGGSAGLSIDALGTNRVFPICRPALTRGEHALRNPSDLARCTLLDSNDDAYHPYSEPRQPGWTRWLESAGVIGVGGGRHMNLTPRVLMHSAVQSGLGVGLSRSLIAVDALAAREVAVPFGPALPVPMTYNLVYPARVGKRKDVSAFRDWILAEAQSSTLKLERMLKRYIVRSKSGSRAAAAGAS